MFNYVYTFQADFVGPGASAVVRHKDVWVDAQAFLFVPGWTFLGAAYSATIAQRFVSVAAGPPTGFVSFAGMFGTYVRPVDLSWKLGDSGFYVKVDLATYVPDGTVQGPRSISNVGNPWWTIQPELAISYLRDGWNLTAYFEYEVNTDNYVDGYHSGDVLHADLTATRTIGKWTLGPVGYYAAQVTPDTVSVGDPINHGTWATFAAGGLLGYDFGPASLMVWGTDEVWSRASGGATPHVVGDTATMLHAFTILAKLSFKVWEPEDQAASTKRPSIYK